MHNFAFKTSLVFTNGENCANALTKTNTELKKKEQNKTRKTNKKKKRQKEQKERRKKLQSTTKDNAFEPNPHPHPKKTKTFSPGLELHGG